MLRIHICRSADIGKIKWSAWGNDILMAKIYNVILVINAQWTTILKSHCLHSTVQHFLSRKKCNSLLCLRHSNVFLKSFLPFENIAEFSLFLFLSAPNISFVLETERIRNGTHLSQIESERCENYRSEEGPLLVRGRERTGKSCVSYTAEKEAFESLYQSHNTYEPGSSFLKISAIFLESFIIA